MTCLDRRSQGKTRGAWDVGDGSFFRLLVPSVLAFEIFQSLFRGALAVLMTGSDWCVGRGSVISLRCLFLKRFRFKLLSSSSPLPNPSRERFRPFVTLGMLSELWSGVGCCGCGNFLRDCDRLFPMGCWGSLTNTGFCLLMLSAATRKVSSEGDRDGDWSGLDSRACAYPFSASPLCSCSIRVSYSFCRFCISSSHYFALERQYAALHPQTMNPSGSFLKSNRPA